MCVCCHSYTHIHTCTVFIRLQHQHDAALCTTSPAEHELAPRLAASVESDGTSRGAVTHVGTPEWIHQNMLRLLSARC